MQEGRTNAGLFSLSTVKLHGSMAALRRASADIGSQIHRKYRRVTGSPDGHTNRLGKEKTRPGGQPDGSSHMGAWGGWALAPNTA